MGIEPSVKTTLQNAAEATGNGTAMRVAGLSTLGVQVSGTFTATVTFEGTIDGTNWVALLGLNANTLALVSTATAAGLFQFNVAGLQQFRARISVYTNGSVTAIGYATSVAGIVGVAAAILGAANNNIGDVDIASLPSGNLGQQLKAASLSVAPATDITDATYIGDIKFGEALPAGTANIGKVDSAASTPALYTVTMTLANTEYSQVLPANTRRVIWQCRTAYDVRFAWATGKVGGSVEPYMTLKAARTYDSGTIAQGASPSTLYIACATAAQVVEIEAWT